MTSLAEGHALQVDRAFWLNGRAGCKGRCFGDGLRLFRLIIDVHSVCWGFCLSVPSKFPQYPPNALLPHGDLNIDPFIRIATHEFRAPDDNVPIFKELGDNVEALVLEELHELILAVA